MQSSVDISRVRSIAIPAGVEFSSLRLRQRSDEVDFDVQPLHRIWFASGVDFDPLAPPSPRHAWEWIDVWYEVHRVRGGSADPVQEARLARKWRE